MTGKNDKFSRMHEAAVAAVLHTTSLDAAAKSIGLNEKTLRRWWVLPEFQAKYRAGKRELINTATHTLLHATGSAVRCLVKIMDDPAMPPMARVSAARSVLAMVLQDIRNDDVDARFTALEARLFPEIHTNGKIH